MTRRMSMATHKEIRAAVGQRYRRATRGEKGLILDEFVALTAENGGITDGSEPSRLPQFGNRTAIRLFRRLSKRINTPSCGV